MIIIQTSKLQSVLIISIEHQTRTLFYFMEMFREHFYLFCCLMSSGDIQIFDNENLDTLKVIKI